MANRPDRATSRRPNGQQQRWYSISAVAQRPSEGPSYAEIYIYDEIDPYWGISAQALVDELAQLDVDEIDLHINSPGGYAFDGIALYQAFVDHRATVTVYVDSLAASAASVIAMAGERVVMGRMAQMMIHDASGLCIGNADDMRQMADMLERTSNTIAIAYSDHAGGTVNQWRKAMRAETWYSANEAVAAGLADEVAAKPGTPDGDDEAATARMARWDLAARFRYPGRDAAPAPQATAAEPPAEEDTEADNGVDIPAAEIESPAADERGSAGDNEVTGIDGADVDIDDEVFAGAADVFARATEPTFAGDPLDVLAVLEHEANNRPVPTISPTRDESDPLTVTDVMDALWEALR